MKIKNKNFQYVYRKHWKNDDIHEIGVGNSCEILNFISLFVISKRKILFIIIYHQFHRTKEQTAVSQQKSIHLRVIFSVVLKPIALH